MSVQQPKPGDKITITLNDFQGLLDTLAKNGYRNIGPTKRDEAIVYDDISRISDLPKGWTDEQNNATYRLLKRSDEAFFGYSLGVQSWKRFLHQPTKQIWAAKKDRQRFEIEDKADDFPKMALIGVRPCELSAIAILDKVLIDGPYRDHAYAALRKKTFVVAVNCSHACGTCFCVSMKTGPKAISGFDLALTELIDSDTHQFLIEVGSDSGANVVSTLRGRNATKSETDAAEAITLQTAKQMGRSVDTADLKEILYRNSDNPQWDAVAKRCLSCSNCTMVCPTCFCTTVEDTTDLLGTRAERIQKWDSCFTIDYSYIHGGSIRTSTKSRYRQWATHKFAAWYDQFGSSGCVGCGRCITWCPAAIDITEEVRAIRESERTAMAAVKAKEGSNANN
jgi:sulfhydrogenase subunit beta (sulfur reductase)